MVDKNKVIKGLSYCAKGEGCLDCPYCEYKNGGKIDICTSKLAQEALELLTEHNIVIDAVTVVKCKYCENRPDPHGTELNGEWHEWCEHLRRWTTDDWYCADGKRKDNDD